jgi:hypothetical protein
MVETGETIIFGIYAVMLGRDSGVTSSLAFTLRWFSVCALNALELPDEVSVHVSCYGL